MNNPHDEGAGYDPQIDTKNMIFKNFMEFEGALPPQDGNMEAAPGPIPGGAGIFPQVEIPQGFNPPMNGEFAFLTSYPLSHDLNRINSSIPTILGKSFLIFI